MTEQDISDLINLDRVEILEETDDSFRVKYGNHAYQIAKSDKSAFLIPSAPTLGLEMKLEQQLVLDTGVFQDDSAPEEFKEVMMFHELREMEYKDHGFEDGHDRAVNDELLYITKFFDSARKIAYLQFFGNRKI